MLPLLAAAGLVPAPAQADEPARSYVVVYEESTGGVAGETAVRETELGFHAEREFRHAVDGFAAELTPGQVRELRTDAEIAAVAPDRPVHATGGAALARGDFAPAGVRRILAAGNGSVRQASSAAVAVLDTGIHLNHPDLNASAGTNCIAPGTPPTDVRGHGTHVAGTIAARNNGKGVVGVAPGTKVYAVKVLNDEGRGKLSTVLCGIEWVTAHARSLGIKVANMSLSGDGPRVRSCETTTDPKHRAICASTAAGITYVASAGNDSQPFDRADKPRVPAAYPEVLTVTASADADGKPGASGKICRAGEADEAVASFSDFASTAAGAAHTVAAPGVCVQSTLPGGYGSMSGTSMAAPHVAGVAALCLGEAGDPGPCAGDAPAQIVKRIRETAEAYNRSHGSYGFWGDALRPLDAIRYFGFLVRAPAPRNQPNSPGGPGPAQPQPPDHVKQESADLRIRSARLRGKPRARLIVRGGLEREAAGLRLLIAYRAARIERSTWTRVNRRGRFTERIRLRGEQRGARAVRVTVTFPGTAHLRPERERARARR
jgi:subtilisin family serine protease